MCCDYTITNTQLVVLEGFSEALQVANDITGRHSVISLVVQQ